MTRTEREALVRAALEAVIALPQIRATEANIIRALDVAAIAATVPESDELAALRARVAELELELATARLERFQ